MPKTKEPKTHDYGPGNRGWGHDINVHQILDGGQKIKVTGFGTGVRTGDFLLLDNGGAETRYRVTEIEYYRDPQDMFRAELDFAPRDI